MENESRNNSTFVYGRILISAATKAFSGATVRIFLEDISRAEVPAQIAAKSEVGNIEHQPDESEK